MVSTDKKNRVKSADLFKGVGIIGIVFVHVFTQSESAVATNATGGFGDSPAIELVYSGLMVFFLLSGYFYREGSGCVKNIVKRVIQIVPPFLICGVALTLIIALWGTFFGYVSSVDEIVQSIIDAVTANAFKEPTLENIPYSKVSLGYYYLMTLLSGAIIFYVIADKVLKNWKYVVATVVAMLAIAAGINAATTMNLPLRLQTAPIVAAMMLVGAFMKKYDVLSFLENEWKTLKYWLILIPIAAIGILFATFFPSTLQFSENVFGEHGPWSVFTYFVLTLCCGYVLLAICGIVCRVKPITRFFKIFSVYSMYILLLHSFFVKFLATPFFGIATSKYFPHMDIGPEIIISVLSIALSIMTAFISWKIYSRIKTAVVAKRSSDAQG